MSESEHWQQVKEVLHQALEREGNDRAAFLTEACAGDELYFSPRRHWRN